MSNKICVICGYGIYLSPNPDYENYLRQAAGYCRGQEIDCLITAGGFTNPKYPQVSEASSIADFIKPLLPQTKITCEDASLTSFQNLEFSKRIIDSQIPKPENLSIICDSIRVPKVFLHSLQIFFNITGEKALRILIEQTSLHNLDVLPDPITFSYENVNIFGISLSRDPKIIAHQITAGIIESNYWQYPELHQEFINWRKKQWGIK